MTDNESVREIEIDGADSATWRFRTWGQFETWLNESLEAWSFLRTQPGSDPANLAHYVVAQLNNALQEARFNRDEKSSIAEAAEIYSRHLRGTYGPPHPKSDRGKMILEIREIAGDQAARFAFAFLQGLITASHAQGHDDWRGMILALNPELLAISGPASRLAAERANYSAALRRLSSEIDAREGSRQREWEQSYSAAGQAAVDWHMSMTRRWLKGSSKLRKRHRVAMEKLLATDAAFTEKMALQAPVEYWENKARAHRKAENEMQGWLWLYFPLAFMLIVGLFGGVGYYLLNTPVRSLPPGIYIVASAGLASAAGMLFWIGRLVTKLYLSQHHLRQDAEERATMTTTYLALTAEKAASDGDRSIILNALFRNTPDGIVKEDGGLDPSIAAALGRFLAR